MSGGMYWLIALGVFVVWLFGVMTWAGYRSASGHARRYDFWDPDGPVGEGWILVAAALWGLPFSAGWFGTIPLGIFALLLLGAYKAVERGYLARVGRARKQVRVLEERATSWEEIARQEGQILSTRDAAVATAASLREQARAVRIPRTDGR